MGTRPIWVLLILMPPDFLMPNFMDLVGWKKARTYRVVPPLLEKWKHHHRSPCPRLVSLLIPQITSSGLIMSKTRSDGSYELKNLPVLPDGEEWVVFAEPPFDSESFQGFRESNQTVVSLDDGETKTVNHVLQGSNVFGRVMFPKRIVILVKPKIRDLVMPSFGLTVTRIRMENQIGMKIFLPAMQCLRKLWRDRSKWILFILFGRSR